MQSGRSSASRSYVLIVIECISLGSVELSVYFTDEMGSITGNLRRGQSTLRLSFPTSVPRSG